MIDGHVCWPDTHNGQAFLPPMSVIWSYGAEVTASAAAESLLGRGRLVWVCTGGLGVNRLWHSLYTVLLHASYVVTQSDCVQCWVARVGNRLQLVLIGSLLGAVMPMQQHRPAYMTLWWGSVLRPQGHPLTSVLKQLIFCHDTRPHCYMQNTHAIHPCHPPIAWSL